MSFGSQINYKQLLQRHKRIRVPMIQRDYAQGRPAEAEVRDEFLEALKDALLKPADDPTLPLNLDFIYGSVEGDEETRFLPLDGQQRLTTLFLLHWYLAWQDDQWEVFAQLFQADGHARFSYSVRPSSNEFFDQLVSYRPSVNSGETKKLTQLISDQPWYFRSWRLDPTIQAVLYMLDAIHENFAISKGFFLRLIDETQPAITFQLLDLENFGLSDDLYIKMNARGKPLTAFETFKARYEQDLKDQLDELIFDISGQSFSAADYIARRMDTTWADMFWKRRNKISNLYDDAFMNVFRAVALITRKPDDAGYLEDVSMLVNRWKAPSYRDFHAHGWLDEQFTLTLIHLLDSWSAGNGSLTCLLPDARYFDEKAFFDEITAKGANLPYTDIVQFAAYVGFIAKYHDSIDSHTFQEWMRIIYNLSINTDYNRPDDLRRSIRGLHVLLENSKDVLQYFAETGKPVSGFSAVQIAEEKLKAKLILAHGDWREMIDRAERHGYFRGQIGFLLDFSGTVAKRLKSEPINWNASDHTSLQKRFFRYLRFAEKMFSANGLVNLKNYRWQRALLSIDDYLLPRGPNYSFLVNSQTDEASWKRLLRGTGRKVPEARKLLKQLWERLSPDEDIVQQLDSIINTAQQLEPWRQVMVDCHEAFEYCESNNVRRHNSDTFYLLKRIQLNGAHAELFTYYLYQTLKKQGKKYKILGLRYKSVNDTQSEPRLQLSCSFQYKKVTFSVLNKDDGYQIRVAKSDCLEITNLEGILKRIGYFETNEFFQNWSSRSDIETHLNELDEALNSGYNNEVNYV